MTDECEARQWSWLIWPCQGQYNSHCYRMCSINLKNAEIIKKQHRRRYYVPTNLQSILKQKLSRYKINNYKVPINHYFTKP